MEESRVVSLGSWCVHCSNSASHGLLFLLLLWTASGAVCGLPLLAQLSIPALIGSVPAHASGLDFFGLLPGSLFAVEALHLA